MEQTLDQLHIGYDAFRKHVSQFKDVYKNELEKMYYPLITIIYARLIALQRADKAVPFVLSRLSDVPPYYIEFLVDLMHLQTESALMKDAYVSVVRKRGFSIRMSKYTYKLFGKLIKEEIANPMLKLIDSYVKIDTYKSRPQTDRFTADAIFGAPIGETMRRVNKTKIDMTVEDEIGQPELDSVGEGAEGQVETPLCKDLPFKVALLTITHTPGRICCAKFSADVSMLALGLSNHTIEVWSLASGGLSKLKHSEPLIEHDNRSRVHMVDSVDTEDHHVFYGHEGVITDCAFALNGDWLLSCSSDTRIILWSLKTWTLLRVIRGHKSIVWSVVFAPNGNFFASCSMDLAVCVWATGRSPGLLRIFNGHLDNVTCVLFHPNSKYLASGSDDRILRLWDLLDSKLMRTMTGHKAPISALAFSKCGNYLASGGYDKAIKIWNLRNGGLVASLLEHTGAVIGLQFSRDNSVLLARGTDGKLSFWEFEELTDDYAISNIHLASDGNHGEYYILDTYQTASSLTIMGMIFCEGSFVQVFATKNLKD